MKASERILQFAADRDPDPVAALKAWLNSDDNWVLRATLLYIDELEARVVALEKAKVDGGK